MTELRDFSMEPEKPGGDRGPTPKWPFLVLAAVLLLALVAFLLFRRGPAEEPESSRPESVAEEERPEPETAELETPPEVDLPPLDQSDEWMREVVAQLSAYPKLARWLLVDDLVRRFAVVVDNVAEGVSPRTHLPFLLPERPFKTREVGGRLVVDSRGYRRYDDLAAVAESLDVRGTAELYRSVKPLIQSAYEELGYPGRDFDDTLARAIRRLLETPVLEGDIALVPKVASFAFADPELEGLSAAQKHFLRMGPGNLRRLQAAARQVAGAIGIPQERLGG